VASRLIRADRGNGSERNRIVTRRPIRRVEIPPPRDPPPSSGSIDSSAGCFEGMKEFRLGSRTDLQRAVEPEVIAVECNSD
jgi:hypothetical protein